MFVPQVVSGGHYLTFKEFLFEKDLCPEYAHFFLKAGEIESLADLLQIHAACANDMYDRQYHMPRGYPIPPSKAHLEKIWDCYVVEKQRVGLRVRRTPLPKISLKVIQTTES